ncbi:MAG: hypothetical protein IJV85_06185 [Clostridia bacterium]|nr:hypothetical protein [Clostridia bacterium]MBQ9729161.1 hypothetical protein [Clostridia bacterium]
MEKFTIGLVVGCVGGALLTANNYRMRALIRKGQEEVQSRFDKMVDEKLEEMDEKSKKEEEKAAKKAAKKAEKN